MTCSDNQHPLVFPKGTTSHVPTVYPAATPPAELNQEQRALLDFLILARARRFVGIGASTFSYYLREYRALHYGLPRSTSFLLNTSRVGTDRIFEAAGRVAPPEPELLWLAGGCAGVLGWLRPACWGGGNPEFSQQLFPEIVR